MTDRLSELRELTSQATPGPWSDDGNEGHNDAALIAAMRNALPDLLAVVEAAMSVPHHRPQPECCTCGLCEMEAALAKLTGDAHG